VTPAVGWRLLDFADLSDVDFVWEAHRALLARSPSHAEVDRRLGELRDRSSRMEIVVRLALSPEGRRARRPPVRGFGFSALSAAAGAIEAAKASPSLARAAARSEALARLAINRKLSRSVGDRGRASTRSGPS
jgi:hypothetical protein